MCWDSWGTYLRKLCRDPKEGEEVWGQYITSSQLSTATVYPFHLPAPTTALLKKLGPEGCRSYSTGGKQTGLPPSNAPLVRWFAPKANNPIQLCCLEGKPTKTTKRKHQPAHENYHVHSVLYQPNAWVDENITTKHWAPAFETSDLEMLGLADQIVLLLYFNMALCPQLIRLILLKKYATYCIVSFYTERSTLRFNTL